MAKEGQTFADALTVFGDKSQAADNLENLKNSIGSALMEAAITGGDIQDILGRTETNIGADLGGGYGLGVGLNVPSPRGKEDYRIKLTKSFQEGGEVGGVDWNFISALEGGSQTEGYIPTDDGKVVGKSGLTIGTGWDVGQMSLKELESSGLPPELIEKVSPFVGLKGKEALSKLEEIGAPVLEGEEASIIDAFTHNKTLSQISKNYEKASGESFEDLSSAQQTVLASVGFQYGSDLKKATPGFWKQVTSGDWEGAQENLLDFGDKYRTRRGKEAELLGAETIARQLAEKGT